MRRVEFNAPFVTGKEREYIDEVFENGHFSGNGPFTKRVHSWLESHLGAPRVLLTHSCTAALEMAAMMNGLGPGDEVLMPSFTFVTTASSVMRTGATPVFCEIDPHTMLIDLHDAERRLTSSTKAIIPVHYAGAAPDMDSLLSFSDEHGIAAIEDAAQGLGSDWNGRPLGTMAPLSAISFHETKNIHCGLGGCLVINDDGMTDLAEVIWERGTDRRAFHKGLVDKYSWMEVGSSFYPSELQAAFLLAQLESMEANLNKRRGIWETYHAVLSEVSESAPLSLLAQSAGTNHNGHLLAIIIDTPVQADSLRAHLNDNGVQAVIHYVPLHESNMGSKLGYSPNDLPLTSEYAGRLIRLPMHNELVETDVLRVTELIRNFFKSQ